MIRRVEITQTCFNQTCFNVFESFIFFKIRVEVLGLNVNSFVHQNKDLIFSCLGLVQPIAIDRVLWKNFE